MPEQELSYWLALSQLSALGLPKLRRWLSAFSDFRSLFEAKDNERLAFGFSVADLQLLKEVNWQSVDKQQAWYEKNAKVLTLNDPNYPPLLKEIADPPLLIYVAGDPQLLMQPQLAIVGSRHPSAWGLETAALFAKDLAERGLLITSGLAKGIDTACHQGTLEAKAKTLAVMGTGLNQIYPRENERLAERIREQGALITEFPLNTRPAPWNFPRRNRIISGLSLGTLVVEAAPRSGSLITARFALEQNREVFAIPGSIHNTLAKGCHQLIRQGAKLVESAQDILEELGALAAFVQEKSAPQLSQRSLALPQSIDKKQLVLLKAVDYAVTALDAILLRSGLTAGEVSSMLLDLELNGYVQAVQGGYQRSR